GPNDVALAVAFPDPAAAALLTVRAIPALEYDTAPAWLPDAPPPTRAMPTSTAARAATISSRLEKPLAVTADRSRLRDISHHPRKSESFIQPRCNPRTCGDRNADGCNAGPPLATEPPSSPRGRGGVAMQNGTTTGAVYLQTNDAEKNELVAYARAADGSLSYLGAYATGGRGTGEPHLPSQSSVVLGADGRWLLVANPGSDEISLSAVADGDPSLSDTTSSGGSRPTSIAVDGSWSTCSTTARPASTGSRSRTGSSVRSPIRSCR